jgi:pimeloyl-ACP methyl ester carboxylesterase
MPDLLTLALGPIEYRLIDGDPARPTIVLLHEGLGCVELWRDFPEQLAALTGCAVFLYSRYGYGGSAAAPLPWPLDYMQREGCGGLSTVLEAAQIERYILLGHSDGASIALVHAGSALRAGLQAVIALAPHVFTEPFGLKSISAARDEYPLKLRAKLEKYHRDNVDCAFQGWSGAWLHSDFLAWNIEGYLSGIKQAVLLIQGEDDQYGTTEQLRRIERRVSGPIHTHVLKHCKHAPQIEQPQVTLELIGRFVAGVSYFARGTSPERR